MTDMQSFEKMDAKEIATFVAEKRTLIQSARFGMGTRDTKSIKAAKREIARALTSLNSRTTNN